MLDKVVVNVAKRVAVLLRTYENNQFVKSGSQRIRTEHMRFNGIIGKIFEVLILTTVYLKFTMTESAFTDYIFPYLMFLIAITSPFINSYLTVN